MIESAGSNLKRVSEHAIVFGRQKSLVGIVTSTVPSTAQDSRPAMVILNTGIIHRVGHNRMYVALSRTLADAGYTVLRFDLSGIGDSDPRAEGLTPLETSLTDIREALEWLESVRGASRFILIGLCSGADHALIYGHADSRVVGLVLIDPWLPPTLKYYVKYITARVLQLQNWRSVATGKSRILQMLREQIARALGLQWHFQPESTPNSVVRYLEGAYQTLVEREAQLLAIFTGGVSVRHNYREQLLDAFPQVAFKSQLRLENFEDCDHTFTSESDRVRLARVIVEWADKIEFCGASGSYANDQNA